MTDTTDLLTKWTRDLGRVLGDELVIELGRRGAGELLTLIHTLAAGPRIITTRDEERDELAAIITAPRIHTNTSGDKHRATADAILAAGYRKPRIITTAAELDALPDGTVVLIHGAAWQSDDGNWWTHVNHNPYSSHELAVIAYGHIGDPGAITVIHTPQTPHTSPDVH